MGAFDNTTRVYVFRLFNVRKVKFVPKPGTSAAEGKFDMLEVARFKFDFPLPEVILYIRTLSLDDIQNQFYVRRVTVGTKKIFYDELNLNIVPLEIPSIEDFPLNKFIPYGYQLQSQMLCKRKMLYAENLLFKDPVLI